MDREVLFAKTLEEVRKKARRQGGQISRRQVQEAFGELALEEAQLAMVFDYLEKHKVIVTEGEISEEFSLPEGDKLWEDEELSEEERNYLQDYLDEIALLGEVSEGEKEAITLAAMAGEREAQLRLAELYLKDVVEIARLYTGQGVYLEDLIGEGNVAVTLGTGMLGCLEKPSEAQGMLARMVMDAMEELIEENRESGKVDKKVETKVNAVADKAKELSEELRRKVTVEELAEESGMSVKTINDAIRMSGFKIEDIDTTGGNTYE